MYFSILQAIVVAPLIAAGAALPADKRADCLVNASTRDEWVEAGLTRWRTVFSSEGTDVSKFCSYWVAGPSDINPQCGYDAGVDGGSWRVDISTPRGPVGDDHYRSTLANNLFLWVQDTGCRTG